MVFQGFSAGFAVFEALSEQIGPPIAALTVAGRRPMFEAARRRTIADRKQRRRNMVELNVKGMMCGGCASSVEKAIKRVDADAAVKIDLASGKVSVETKADAKALGDAIEAAGYEVAA